MTTKIVLDKELTETLFNSLDEDARLELAQSAIRGTIGKYIKKVVPLSTLEEMEESTRKGILDAVEKNIGKVKSNWEGGKYKYWIELSEDFIRSSQVFDLLVAKYVDLASAEIESRLLERQKEYRKDVNQYIERKESELTSRLDTTFAAHINEEYRNDLRKIIRQELIDILKEMGNE